MQFIPVQSEKISTQGGQTQQGNSAGVDNSGLFGSLLAGQLAGPGKAASVNASYKSFGDAATLTDHKIEADELVQLLDLENLQGRSKQQLLDLIKKVLGLLQNDSKGKQLIEALKDGELSLALPLELTEDSGKQANETNLGFLVIQQGRQFTDKASGSSTRTNSEAGEITDEAAVNALLNSLRMNLILTGGSGGEALETSLRSASAGTLQMAGDQMIFQSEKSGSGTIPVILMQSGGSQTAKSAVSITQSMQTLDKAAVGEIATLLKSLQGQMEVQKSRGKNRVVENTRSSIHRFSAERQNQHIAQKVAQTQAEGSVHNSSNYSTNQSGTQQKLTGNNQQLFQNLTNQNTTIEFGDELQVFASGDIFSPGGVGAKGVTGTQLGQARPVLAQVIQKIDAMVQAVKTHQSMNQPQVLNARLALEPKHLGSLVMQLRYQSDTITGTIIAASREAKNIIEHSLPMLKDALLSHHTHLQDVKVEIQQNFTSDQSADSFQHQFAGQSGQDGDSDVPFEEFDLDAILQETGETVSSLEENSFTSYPTDGWYA